MLVDIGCKDRLMVGYTCLARVRICKNFDFGRSERLPWGGTWRRLCARSDDFDNGNFSLSARVAEALSRMRIVDVIDRL